MTANRQRLEMLFLRPGLFVPALMLIAVVALLVLAERRLLTASDRSRAAEIRAALSAERLDEADSSLRRWLAASPDAAEPYLLQAHLAWKRNRINEAAQSLERASRLGQKGPELDRLWGLVLAKSGRTREAEAYLHRAWDDAAGKRADPEVAESLSRIALERFDLGLALGVVDRWAHESPSDPTPLVRRAEVDRRIGADRATTMAHFQEALSRDAGCDAARLGLAELLYLSGRYADSAAAYAAHAARHPEAAIGYVGMGINARISGDTAMAAAHLDRGLKLDPTNTLALKERASIDLAQGHDSDALSLLDRAVAADPFDPELLYQRSVVHARMGRPADAHADRARSEQLRREHARMAEIESALVANPQNAALQVEAAQWMIAHGRAEEAIVWARMVLQDQPDNPDANRLLADYHQTRGEWALANYYRLHLSSAVPSAVAKPVTTGSK